MAVAVNVAGAEKDRTAFLAELEGLGEGNA